MYTKLLYSYLFLFISLATYGQSYIADAQHFGVEHGLSHQEVHSIFQDKNGFIWLGTKKGLNRFDGYDFNWWTREDYGFDFNKISRIGQDDAGWLWLWNDKSILFLQAETFEIQTLEERFGDHILFESRLKTVGSWKYWNERNMFRDQTGKLYLQGTTPNQLVTYHSTTGFQTIYLKNLEHILIKYVMPNGNIWAEHSGQLLHLSSKGEILEKYG